MTSIGHGNDASLAGFMAGWDKRFQENEQLPVSVAVIALTNWGERPVPSAHLAEALGLSVSEVEARAQGHCTIGTPVADPEDTLFRVEDGLITFKVHFDPERPTRRRLRIGGRRVRTTVGCAPDVFLYAPLLRPSVQVEESCPVTGTPMRLVFTPSGVESADPAGVVVPIPPPKEFDLIGLERMTPDEADASCCAQSPFYSSAKAAQGWLAAHPGGRVFPVREAWDLSFHRVWRDRMSALLNLGD